MKIFDTIGAISTPTGSGGIGIIRISGSLALKITYDLIGFYPPPRISLVCFFLDRKHLLIDRGVVIFYKKPYTYTGEDVVELHCHGNFIITKKLLTEVLYLGARQAQPGEFSARAFLNKKLNLLQVEALSSLLGIKTQGKNYNTSSSILTIQQSVQLKLIERFSFFLSVKVDFYNLHGLDNIEHVKNKHVFVFYFSVLYFYLMQLEKKLSTLFCTNLTKDVYFLGQTNVGKSSFLNVVSKKVVSLVHKFPGTTRDLVQYDMVVDGKTLVFYDTVGFNFSMCNKIELCGLHLLQNKLKMYSVLILMFDIVQYYSFCANRFYMNVFRDFLKENSVIYVVINKIDHFGLSSFTYNGVFSRKFFLSVKNGTGISLLLSKVKDSFRYLGLAENVSTVDLTQKKIHKSVSYITKCLEENAHNDFVSVQKNLNYCHNCISDVLGQGVYRCIEDLFSNFCVGK